MKTYMLLGIILVSTEGFIKKCEFQLCKDEGHTNAYCVLEMI